MTTLILGLFSCGIVVWLLIEIRYAIRNHEIRFLRMPDGRFLDRHSRPVMFWATLGWTVVLVLFLSVLVIDLLFGIDVRWWL